MSALESARAMQPSPRRAPAAFPRVVGLVGHAGAGKSFAAQMLGPAYGYERVRFAGPLKGMMLALGCTPAQVDGADKETPCDLLGGRTPRQAMQWLGTEWGRDLIASDLWTRAWALAADRVLARGGLVVADDVRFANEVQMIRDRGGVVLRIARAGAGSVSGAGHASERLDLAVDATVQNPGQPDAYRMALVAALERWRP